MQIKKKIKKVFMKYILKKERVFIGNNEIKYLFLDNKKSKKLVVVFSGFAGHNEPARYNYIRTLLHTNTKKLFILDDFGYKKVGSYYLGNNCRLYDSRELEELITKIISEHDITETVFCGSSKGGSTALIYGCRMGVDHIIAGSPQYRIADYLNENDYHKCILESIKRNDGNDNNWLNNCINTAIKNADVNTKITVMFSSKEEAYENDIKHLIEDLKKHFKDVELIDKGYIDHSEIGQYFSRALPKLL